jgi:phosphomethylpyrimidine synthase
MRITHDIRDAYEKGMAEKSREFADGGNRVYLPLSTPTSARARSR